MLEVELYHHQGAFTLDVAFAIDSSSTALFGPSGSGKTTLLNAVAGLVRPERGRILVDGDVLLDTGRNIFVPPYRRRMGYVFQDGRLFPHLTVRQNLLFGRFFAARSKTPAHGLTLDQVIDLLGIRHILNRRPSNLSGGEVQRVAIGRALLAEPRMLLMDEPLASLDDGRKAEIMPILLKLRDEARLPILYVSHVVGEAATIAVNVIVMENGHIASIRDGKSFGQDGVSRSDERR